MDRRSFLAGAAVLAHPRGLEHVEALDDHDVGAVDDDLLVGDDVVAKLADFGESRHFD